MADHYRVDPVDLEETARRIEDVLARFARVGELTADAQVGDRAWGEVGRRGRLHAQYGELLHATAGALAHLSEAIDDGAVRLRRSAHGYAVQERVESQRLASPEPHRLSS